MGELLYPLGLTESEKHSIRVPDYSSDYYRMDYRYEEIRSFTHRVHTCISKGSFIVLKGDPCDPENSRQKNSDCMRIYGLWKKEHQKKLLLSVTADEFCHTIHASDGSRLYVYCADRTLYKAASGYCSVRLYIKHDCREKGRPFDVVISLHELEYPIIRAFGE